MHRCERDDPQVNDCLRFAANKLTHHLRDGGIPEIGIVDVSMPLRDIIIDYLLISDGLENTARLVE